MSTKAEAVFEEQLAPYAKVIAAAAKELSSIRKANKVLDAEIRRLEASTRKSLDRIQDNLRHVEATR